MKILVLLLLSTSLSHSRPCEPVSLFEDQNINQLNQALSATLPNNQTINSCKNLDPFSPILQDPDFKDQWCAAGCTRQITQAQQDVYMPDMASEEAKDWHADWHRNETVYDDPSIYSELAETLRQKRSSRAGINAQNFTEADLHTLSLEEITGSFHRASRTMTELLDARRTKGVPSVCHHQIPLREQRILSDGSYFPSYQNCLDNQENQKKDVISFLVGQRDASGENFLFMHHQMRNHVQSKLSAAGLPCMMGYQPVPGPDGKTGHKFEDGSDELWAPTQDILTPSESPDDDFKKNAEELVAKILAAIERGVDPESAYQREVGWRYGPATTRYIFEDENFLKKLPLGLVGRIMEGGIHGQLHRNWARSGETCNYQGAPAGGVNCYLSSPQTAHINPKFWKIHGWCDDIIQRWVNANGYTGISTSEECNEGSKCYRWKGTWAGNIPDHF